MVHHKDDLEGEYCEKNCIGTSSLATAGLFCQFIFIADLALVMI